MRIGIGYDIHRFIEGKLFMLGGVDIPYSKGLDGHSDADALLHAVCDAILGAAGLDDIGCQFPVNDDKYAGIASIELLKKVNSLITEKGFKVEYVDSVVILEEPNIVRFKGDIKKNIADALNIDIRSVNVKATTQEGVGAIGRGEAMAAYAVVCIEKKLN